MSFAPATQRGIVALSFALSLSQFFRGCLAVIAPELQHDLELSPAGFGALSSCYFLAFGLAQVPVGIAFDRWGVGKPTRWLLALGAVSALLFMVAPSGPLAMVAQAGLGLACAPIFMGLMHYVLAGMPPQRSVRVLGRANALGMLGALAATAPLGWAVGVGGWRPPMLLAAVLMALACAAVWCWVRDEGHAEARTESMGQMLGSSAKLLKLPMMWTLIPMCIGMAAGNTFRNAWGGPYFAGVFGLAADMRGLALAALSGICMVCAVGFPWLVRHSSLRATVLRVTAVGVLSALALALWPAVGLLPNLGMLVVLVSIGVLHPLVMTHGRELLPPAQRGRGLGVLNSFAFGGTAFAAWLFGQVAQAGQLRGWTQPQTFSAIFGLATALALVGLLLYLRSPKPPSDLALQR